MFRRMTFLHTHCTTLVLKKKYSTTTGRLIYLLEATKNKSELNSLLNQHGCYIAKHMHKLSSCERKNLTTELESINFFNTNKKNQAAIIQTQFGVHKTLASFTIYPCSNAAPFDVAYESLIEARPILSSIAILAITQLLNIDEFKSFEGLFFSIVLLKYLTESYLEPHKDEHYLFSLMTTLQGRNMIGRNCIYSTDYYGMPGVMLGDFSDSYYKIVDNREGGVFHDAHIKATSLQNLKNIETVRYVLIAGIKNRLCQSWSKPACMRSTHELLPIGEFMPPLKLTRR